MENNRMEREQDERDCYRRTEVETNRWERSGRVLGRALGGNMLVRKKVKRKGKMGKTCE